MASRTSFTSWIPLCLLCFSLWWAGEPWAGNSVKLVQGLCLLYCLGGYYWAHCVFPVPFGLCGINLPWQRIRNFHCILIWGKDLSVLCLQTTNLIQVQGPVIFAQFLLNFVFSPVSCLKEYKRQAFLSVCKTVFHSCGCMCDINSHTVLCPCLCVMSYVCLVLAPQIPRHFLHTHEFTFRLSSRQCLEPCLCIHLTKLQLSTCCFRWLLWPMSVGIQIVFS